jgi:hypothetical protein
MMVPVGCFLCWCCRRAYDAGGLSIGHICSSSLLFVLSILDVVSILSVLDVDFIHEEP